MLVSASVAGIAAARPALDVAGEFKRGETREVADLAGHHLIDRNARPDLGRALVEPHPGQKDAVAARMVAGAVFSALRVGVIKPAHHLQLVLQGRERLQRGAETEIRAAAFGPP